MTGIPCNLEPILELAREHDLYVIEDACQAIGGSYKGQPLGSMGDAGAFSLNFYKIIGVGEGGAAITRDRAVYDRMRMHHDCGVSFWGRKDGVASDVIPGINYRMSEVLGAFALVQLGRLDSFLAGMQPIKKNVYQAVRGALSPAPQNDADGDCGTTLHFQFDATEAAVRFEAAARRTRRRRVEADQHRAARLFELGVYHEQVQREPELGRVGCAALQRRRRHTRRTCAPIRSTSWPARWPSPPIRSGRRRRSPVWSLACWMRQSRCNYALRHTWPPSRSPHAYLCKRSGWLLGLQLAKDDLIRVALQLLAFLLQVAPNGLHVVGKDDVAGLLPPYDRKVLSHGLLDRLQVCPD